MTGPLAIQCDVHPAPIGVPCKADGTCCARRIARALLVGAGVKAEALEPKPNGPGGKA